MIPSQGFSYSKKAILSDIDSLARSPLSPSLTLSRSAFWFRRWMGSYGLLMQQQQPRGGRQNRTTEVCDGTEQEWDPILRDFGEEGVQV